MITKRDKHEIVLRELINTKFAITLPQASWVCNNHVRPMKRMYDINEIVFNLDGMIYVAPKYTKILEVECKRLDVLITFVNDNTFKNA